MSLGILSKRRDVRNWVMQIPKCQECGFFVTFTLSGNKNDCIWPQCSNRFNCTLARFDTFYNPTAERPRWHCEQAVLALYCILWKMMKVPRDLIRLICQMIRESRESDVWNIE